MKCKAKIVGYVDVVYTPVSSSVVQLGVEYERVKIKQLSFDTALNGFKGIYRPERDGKITRMGTSLRLEDGPKIDNIGEMVGEPLEFKSGQEIDLLFTLFPAKAMLL